MHHNDKKMGFLLITNSEEKAKSLIHEISQILIPPFHIPKNQSEVEEALNEKNWDLVVWDYKSYPYPFIIDKIFSLSLTTPVVLLWDNPEDNQFDFLKSDHLKNVTLANFETLSGVIEKKLSEQKIREAQEPALSELKKKEEVLSMALSVAKMCLWEWDLQSDQVYLSPECIEVLGTEKISGDHRYYSELVIAEDVEEVNRKKQEAIAQKRPIYLEVPFRSPLKGPIWLAIYGRAIYDDEGVPLKVIGVVQDITEYKNVQQKLQQRESHLKLITDSIPVMVVHLDKNLICRFANKAFCDVYSVNHQEVTGKPLHELIGSEKFNKILDGIKKALAGEYFSCDDQLEDAKGRKLYLTMEYLPDLDESGQVSGCFLFLTDNTRKQLAIDYLKESEERFHSLVKATNQIVWVGTLKHSPSLKILFDSSQKHRNILERFHPDDYQKAIQDLRQNAERKTSYTAEYRIFHPDDGTYHVYSSNAYPIIKDERIHEFIGTMNDITEKRRIESEILFQANLLNMVNQAIIATDIEGRITYWNKSAEKLFGYRAAEARGKYVFDLLVDKADIQDAMQILTGVIRGLPWSGEFEMKKLDGSKFITACSLSLVVDEKGKKLIIGMIQDITERKEAERRLQESMEQLRQAQKLESIGRLAGGIAHDFNNMLTAIRGYNELALRQLGNEQNMLRKCLEEISKAAERSSSLIQQLLAFSRRQIMKTEILDINLSIKESVSLIQRLVGENIVIVLSLMSRHRFVKADLVQLSQVLTNLAVNSKDAMPEGGTIIIQTEDVYLDENFLNYHPDAKKGGYVRISFIDNGCGMSEETLAHIFEPFFTTKPVGKGTGLGLSTVYGIVKQLDGFILCKSKIGEGTTFEIFLPMAQEKVENRHKKSENIKTENFPATILLVEDEHMVREVTKQLLESCGYRVFEARNAKEALSICETIQEPIDLLLTDIVMPRMNGYELAFRIREKFPNLPVIFVSGYIDQKEHIKKIQDENTFFIQKPFLHESLTNTIVNILKRIHKQKANI
jgi:PAS domain S-box-containing protein